MAFLFLNFSLAYAQTEKTGPYFNGRFWKGISIEHKAMFLNGLHEGLEWFAIMAQQIQNDQESKDRLNAYFIQNYTCNLSFKEKIEQIDLFYADSANIIIPILWAYSYATIKSKGLSPQQLEKI